mmetsp:Transcript_17101/g.51032  ORF Transcript_17101/g.51032 Transcript_17101/m.51032 type:complete len:219 (-) Transcript_17101:38-694(-)
MSKFNNDYSRFAHIGDSDSDLDEPPPPEGPNEAISAANPGWGDSVNAKGEKVPAWSPVGTTDVPGPDGAPVTVPGAFKPLHTTAVGPPGKYKPFTPSQKAALMMLVMMSTTHTEEAQWQDAQLNWVKNMFATDGMPALEQIEAAYREDFGDDVLDGIMPYWTRLWERIARLPEAEAPTAAQKGSKKGLVQGLSEATLSPENVPEEHAVDVGLMKAAQG